MTGIHSLLEAVSSGQPVVHVSVDDLVHSGQRRQRALLGTTAGATAALIAVAGAAAGIGVGGSSHGAAGGTTTATLPMAPTASAQPVWNGPAGARVPVATMHLLDGGLTLQTTYVTSGCTLAGLSARETASTVTVTLALLAPHPGASSPAGAPKQSCDDPGGDGNPPQAVVPVGTTLSVGSGDLRTTLTAPLGSRRLIDAVTGRTIPYVSDSDVAAPASLPSGWAAFGPLRPQSTQSWQQQYQAPVTRGGLSQLLETLTLTQTLNARADLGGVANTSVGSAPARLTGRTGSLQLRWWVGGRLYVLAYQASTSAPCRTGTSGKPGGGCTIVGGTAPAGGLTKDALLAVAGSVQLPVR